MKLKPLLGVVIAALSLSACASVTRGTTEAFVIETDPPGAQAELSNGRHCTTPCTLTLPRRSNFTVTLTKDGYEDINANVTNTTSGAGAAGMAGNVLIGGLIGVAVDATTGATQDLTPNPLSVRMVPLNEPTMAMDPIEDEPEETPINITENAEDTGV